MSFLNKIKDTLVCEPSDVSSVSHITLQYRIASAFILELVDAGMLSKRDTNSFGHLVLDIYTTYNLSWHQTYKY
jgi:hypothetical protein